MIRIKSLQVLILLVAFLLPSCVAEHPIPEPTSALRGETTVTPSIDFQSLITPGSIETPTVANPLVPIMAKTPGVLDCADIVKAHKESTSTEWEATKISLRGSGYFYTGKVYSVTETDVVHLSGGECHATLHHVPHDIATGLSKGELVEGFGVILNISFYLGEDIDIEVNPDKLFTR
jgi:hypothetical protein